MNPSLALLASIALILLLIRKLHPSLAVFVGALLLSTLSLPIERLPHILLSAILSWQTIRLIIIVASAMTLSSAMEEKGLLANLAKTMEAFGSKRAMHIVPAMIGLVPMPAGAVVSATAVKSIARKLGLKPEEATFINYWFRHIWEFSVPIYQSVVVVSVILGWQLSSVFLALAPLTLLAILAGSMMSSRILKDRPDDRGGPFPTKGFLKASWPILVLVAMILLGLEPAIAFPSALAMLIVQQRFRPSELKKPLKYGLDPKIIFLLYAIMVFKFAIEITGSADALFRDLNALGVPFFVVLVIPTFMLALAGGLSIAFAGLAFPLLVPIIAQVGWPGLILAYASGMAGLLLSPLHLCLVLSSEYFGAELSTVYRYVLPPVLGVEAIASLIFLIT